MEKKKTEPAIQRNQHGLYNDPIPGLQIIDPVVPQGANDVLLGYEIVEVEADEVVGCFTRPQPSRMRPISWFLAGVLCLFIWPASCLPCCLKDSYNTVQRPVYQQMD